MRVVDVARLLNSTSFGFVLPQARLYREFNRVGFRIGSSENPRNIRPLLPLRSSGIRQRILLCRPDPDRTFLIQKNRSFRTIEGADRNRQPKRKNASALFSGQGQGVLVAVQRRDPGRAQHEIPFSPLSPQTNRHTYIYTSLLPSSLKRYVFLIFGHSQINKSIV